MKNYREDLQSYESCKSARAVPSHIRLLIEFPGIPWLMEWIS